tara:strand:+ start:623 stop:856 length:234 start_codon:yes stop_codon:yes gene_type:complete
MTNYRNIELHIPPEMTLDVTGTAALILQQTDWTQIPNSGLTDACVAAFVTYRASIRTIRKTNPSDPTWPDAPTEEWS